MWISNRCRRKSTTVTSVLFIVIELVKWNNFNCNVQCIAKKWLLKMMQKQNKNEARVQFTVFFKTAGKMFPALKKEWSSVVFKKLVCVTPEVTLISQKHVNLLEICNLHLGSFFEMKMKIWSKKYGKFQFWFF